MSIIGYIRNGDFASAFVLIASLLFVVFCTMPVHEYAHAKTAVKLGDDTPRLQGRLTLNPMAHISPLGALMIFLVGFGYAKPVPVNIRNLKKPKRDFAIIALAGPASNLVMALIFMLCYNIIYAIAFFVGSASAAPVQILRYFFYYAASVNVSLAVFNLIPIPPLDGSRVLSVILPDKYYYKLMQYERYIMIALLVLLWIGILNIPLNWLSEKVMTAFDWLTRLPFVLAGVDF